MKLTHIASACHLIEYGGKKILADPWIFGDEYYGSWTHYPPVDIEPDYFRDIDAIYLSHIHPDHFSISSMKHFNKNIPILIHSYDAKFFKKNIENLGFSVTELPHGESYDFGNGLKLYIYAADDCNPELCFKFHGCGKMEKKFGSTSVDTMAVFETQEHVVLNVNDCPWDLSEKTIDRVLNNHKDITFLLVGYTGAGSYPQCWENYTKEQKINIYGKQKRDQFLQMGIKYINKVKPKYYMPFAGTYTLQGPLHRLNELKCVPELEDALMFYDSNISSSTGILLNSGENFNLSTNSYSREYKKINREERDKYIKEVLAHKSFSYHEDPIPTLEHLLELVPKAFSNFERKRKELNYTSETCVYLYLLDNKVLQISCSGENYKVVDESDMKKSSFVSYRVDTRLLARILKGPKYAHWNNAEIGSHIMFSRSPDIYDRALHYCMNFFHG